MRIYQVALLLQVFLLKAFTTNSKVQISSWEANRSSARQKIPCILRNSEVHYRINNSLCTFVRATCNAQFIVHSIILRELRIVKNCEAKKGSLITNSQTAGCDIYSKTTVDLYGVHHTDTVLFIRANNSYSTQNNLHRRHHHHHQLDPGRPVSTSQNIPKHKTGHRTVKT
jgi:hypothetical protein